MRISLNLPMRPMPVAMRPPAAMRFAAEAPQVRWEDNDRAHMMALLMSVPEALRSEDDPEDVILKPLSKMIQGVIEYNELHHAESTRQLLAAEIKADTYQPVVNAIRALEPEDQKTLTILMAFTPKIQHMNELAALLLDKGEKSFKGAFLINHPKDPTVDAIKTRYRRLKPVEKTRQFQDFYRHPYFIAIREAMAERWPSSP
jgi:hypothetical protein